MCVDYYSFDYCCSGFSLCSDIEDIKDTSPYSTLYSECT